MTRATTDGLFVELGYFDPEDYFVYVAEAESTASAEFAVVCDATEIPGGVVVEFAAALSAATAVTIAVTKIIQAAAEFSAAFTPTLTAEAFKNYTAVLDVAFDLESTAVKTVDPGGLLEFFADLNNAADRFRDNSSAISAEFAVGNNNGIGGIGTNVILESAASLESVAALSCDGVSVTIVDFIVDLTANVGLTADAIEYVRKSNLPASSGARPWATNYISQDLSTEDAPVFDSNTKKFGSHSFRFRQNDSVNSADNSYVKYYSSNSVASFPNTVLTGETYQLDFWARGLGQLVRAENTSNARNQFRITASSTSLLVQYWNGSNYSSISSTWANDGVWRYITLKAESKVLKLYVDGTLRATSSVNYDNTDANQLIFGDDDQIASSITTGFAFIDEFRVLKGPIATVTDELGYSFSATSITVPTQESRSTASTQILLHFNNTYADDLYGDQFGSAALASAFTIATTVSELSEAAATLTGVSALEINGGKLKEAEAAFEAVASQLTAAAKVGDFLIDASVAANFAITADLFKEYAANFESSTSQSTVAVKNTNIVAGLTDQFTMVTENQGTISFIADLSSEFQTSATGATNKPGAADLAAEFNQTADAFAGIEGGANAASEFTITIDNSRTRDNSSAFEAVAAQLTAAAKTGDFLIDAAVAANLTAVGNVLTGNVIDIAADTAVTVTAIKITDVISAISSASEFAIDAVVGVVAEGNFESTVNLAIDADAIKRAVVAASLTATLAAAANVTARANSSMAATASVVAAPGRTRPGSGAISSAAQLNINAGKRVSATANLPAVSAVLAVGREVRLDVYVYRIPEETRTATIAREIREYEIRQETRTHSIQGT